MASYCMVYALGQWGEPHAYVSSTYTPHYGGPTFEFAHFGEHRSGPFFNFFCSQCGTRRQWVCQCTVYAPNVASAIGSFGSPVQPVTHPCHPPLGYYCCYPTHSSHSMVPGHQAVNPYFTVTGPGFAPAASVYPVHAGLMVTAGPVPLLTVLTPALHRPPVMAIPTAAAQWVSQPVIVVPMDRQQPSAQQPDVHRSAQPSTIEMIEGMTPFSDDSLEEEEEEKASVEDVDQHGREFEAVHDPVDAQAYLQPVEDLNPFRLPIYRISNRNFAAATGSQLSDLSIYTDRSMLLEEAMIASDPGTRDALSTSWRQPASIQTTLSDRWRTIRYSEPGKEGVRSLPEGSRERSEQWFQSSVVEMTSITDM